MGCKIAKGVAAREIKGKYYIVLPKEMKLIKLNNTGSFIFSLLNKKAGEKTIEKKLSAEYGISKEKAGRDLALFIQELKKAKI
ncbi:MAG: PqqD family protein, partial [Candidatus Firestonebacteria bacterium]